MSNINPENNPGNQENISQTSAGRIVGAPRRYETATLADIATVLSQMAAINDRLSINTEKLATFLQQHQQDSDFVRTATGSGARVPGNLTQASALASPRLIDRYQKEQQLLFDELKTLDAEAQRKRLQALGIRRMPEGAPTDILGGPLSPEKGMLGDQIEDALTRQVLREAAQNDPKSIKEAMNLRRLQRLDLKSRLTPAGLMSTIGGMFGQGGGAGGPNPHAHLDPLKDALREERDSKLRAAGKIPTSANIGMGDKAADVLGTAAMRGGLAGGAASLALRAFAPVGIALAIPEVLRRLGINVPSLSQIPAAVRETRASGQLTGEGFGAGVGAWWQARSIRTGGGFFAGINPFDPITAQIADEIVKSVRTAGFTGDRARQLYHSVASVYRDLGLSIETTTKIIADATRVGGESLKQISDELHGFDDAAHSLQMNINTYAESIMAVSTQLRATGAGGVATQAAAAFVAGAPRILREGPGLQQYQAAYQAAQPYMAARLGIPVQYLGLQGNLPHAFGAFEQQVLEEIGRMPGDNLQERAANASRFGIVLRGMDVPNITRLVTQFSRGRGPGETLSIERIRGQLNAQTSRTITRRQLLARGPQWAQEHGLTSEWGDIVTAKRYQHPIDMSETVTYQLGSGNLETRQRAAIQRLRPFLSRPQLAQLQRLVGNQHDFQQRIQEFEAQPRTSQGGRSVTLPNGVTISLSKNASKILRLDTNKEQVYQGTRPSSRQFDSERDRTVNLDPLGAG